MSAFVGKADMAIVPVALGDGGLFTHSYLLGSRGLALTTTWIAAISSLFANSAVGFVKYGLTKPAGILSFMTSFNGCLFRCCLRSVS